MNLLLEREPTTPKFTHGNLYIGSKFECYTLEDTVRSGPKVKHQTAMPAGKYTLVLDLSQRFKKLMPHILDVPGFAGIRIHAGNTEADTSGCILVGQTRHDTFIGRSKLAYEALFAKLQAATERGETITIEVRDAAL